MSLMVRAHWQPAFKGESFERTKPIFWEWRGGDNQDFTWPSLAVRDGKWKLLFNRDTKKMDLYDLEGDWAEASDVARENPEIVQKLKRKLNVWKKSLPTEPAPEGFSSQRQK